MGRQPPTSSPSLSIALMYHCTRVPIGVVVVARNDTLEIGSVIFAGVSGWETISA
jgi:hypothetical protein